jgi:predicted transposase YbfD/YdcC
LQKETRYYISSLPANAGEVSPKIRNHWLIENKLHWMLDVVFGEDASRKRKGNSAKNFNLISKIALSLISKESTKGISGKGKRYKAALDHKFREKILNI